MDYILSSYAIVQFLTALVSIVIAAIMWNRRSIRGGLALFLLFVAISEWALADTMEAAAVSQELKIFWSKVGYLGVQTSPVLILVFAMQYSGRNRALSNLNIILLFIVPLIVIISAATNELHGLVWISFSPGPPGSNSLIYHHGPIFWLGIAYIFTSVAFATTILIFSVVQSQKIYRFQSIVIILASLLPWIGTVLYIFDLSPFPGLDLTCSSFLFTGLLLMIGIVKGNLMDYVPITHELLFKNIDDGVIVFDENLRIIDMNPGAEKQLSMKFDQLIGKNLHKSVNLQPILEKSFIRDENIHFEIVSPYDNKTWFTVSVSPLRNRRNFLGWVAIFEDVTRRKETERKLKQLNKRLKRQLDRNKELQDQLREQANRDALTGVYNRGYLAETLVREIARAERKSYPLSVIMLDVDHFKNINDTFGHKIGDDVVVALGKMLSDQTREADCVSRFGGDEFILVMPEMTAEHAYQRAERWRNEFKEIKFTGVNKNYPFTVSIGLATYPKDGEDYDALLDAVDQALYQAKQSGRDCTRGVGD